jgi:hypothetical protein
MSIKKFTEFLKGIRLRPESSDPSDNASGSLWYNSADQRFKGYASTGQVELATTAQAQTLTNKTINPTGNSITLNSAQILVGSSGNVAAPVSVTGDLTVTSGGDFQIAAGVIVNADISSTAAISRSKLASGTSFATLYNNSSGVVDERLLASGVVVVTDNDGVPTGSTVTTAELALLSGATGAVVTTGAIQTLINKTIDPSANSLVLNAAQILVGSSSNFAAPVAVTGDLTVTTGGDFQIAAGVIIDADINANASIARSKIATGSIDHVIINNASGFLSSEAQLAISRGGTNSSTASGALNNLLPDQTGNAGKVLQTDGTNPAWVAGTISYGDITGQVEDTTPVSGDFVLTADTSATALKKVDLNNLANAFTKPTVQIFTSGSGTYTTPAKVKWIRVTMVGGGGGGGGGSSTAAANGGTGGTGGTTTFGTSLLTCTGGAGGANYGNPGGAGGAATLNSPAVGLAFSGGTGGMSAGFVSTAEFGTGGYGGASPLGGSGGGGGAADAGDAAVSNTGSGGGGGSSTGTSGRGGSGGGAGAYIQAIITSPSASYSYAIGAAGTAGTAGTSGTAGGAGGSGIVMVEEFYT